MRSLKSIFSGLRKPKVSEKHQNVPGRLDQLSAEMVHEIADHLLLELIAVLIRTCRYLYNILQKRYLFDRYALSLLLEKDRPTYVSCFLCRCFHRIDEQFASSVLPATEFGFQDSYDCKARITGITRNFLFWRFSETVYRMTMKLHQQGQGCERFLNLMSAKGLKVFTQSLQWDCTSARICKDKLLVRSQMIYTHLRLERIKLPNRACAHLPSIQIPLGKQSPLQMINAHMC